MDSIIIFITVAIVTVIIRMKVMSAIKAKAIDTIIDQLYDLKGKCDRNENLPYISFWHFNDIYHAVVNNLPAKQRVTSQSIISSLYSEVRSGQYTINQLASLILNRNGYKFRTVHGRRDGQGIVDRRANCS